MLRLSARLVVLAVILAVVLAAEQPLNNEAIVKLHRAGLDDDLIVDMVNTRPGHYATGVDDIIALKQAGISKKVLTAILNRSGGTAPPAASPQATPAATDQQDAAAAAAEPKLSAVYYAKGEQWVGVPAETVNWKVAGGKFKTFASAGVVKRDMNGIVSGAGSKTSVKKPQFLLFVPQNVFVKQYYLLRLKPSGDQREFLAVRVDDFHVRSTRDVVPFEGKEVRRHWFLLTLPAMEPGEYGFLPPEVAAGNYSEDDPGKMYTFHLTE
jgi:hypothetical protein